ncbi:Uncharacterised protein [Mycobacteroides abscessus subsp. abscessus]|nr:Uncharacterised protein [Mycobacteroides abscessus]SIE82758.1 Uncharacterised protein [Mycobacteroides abscessus subsp. abscessus]CPR96638.1 Uncharacterised protein [Mycobacteroides abscessus]CPS40814.1 Uncharacterised protein [Mycobacteroides abscessus]CPV10841.1 Uncharacterised protein [Mycobacteroides abscessus]
MASESPNLGDLFKALAIAVQRGLASHVERLVTQGKCSECPRQYPWRSPDAADWSMTVRLGVPVSLKCPDCQSPEDHAERVMRDATADYELKGGFFVVQRPKEMPDDEDTSQRKAG